MTDPSKMKSAPPREWEITTYPTSDPDDNCGHWVYGPYTGHVRVPVIERSYATELEREIERLKVDKNNNAELWRDAERKVTELAIQLREKEHPTFTKTIAGFHADNVIANNNVRMANDKITSLTESLRECAKALDKISNMMPEGVAYGSIEIAVKTLTAIKSRGVLK